VVTLNALTFVSELVNKVGRAVRPGVVRVGDFPVVEMPCRASLVRVRTRSRHPVEGASYESERSRGVLSSVPHTSQNAVEVSRPLFWLISFAGSVLFFLIVDCGYP
jgi:hypothetical protein